MTSSLLEKHVVKWKRKVVDESLANSLKGNTQQRGKEETKKKVSTLGQKSKT